MIYINYDLLNHFLLSSNKWNWDHLFEIVNAQIFYYLLFQDKQYTISKVLKVEKRTSFFKRVALMRIELYSFQDKRYTILIGIKDKGNSFFEE